jgi:hypothetical protein
LTAAAQSRYGSERRGMTVYLASGLIHIAILAAIAYRMAQLL